MRMKQGLTVHQRQKLREEILQSYLAKAQEDAANARLSITCRRAMRETGNVAALLHEACKGEEPGNGGCLCHHHDDYGRSGFESGQMTES